MMSEKNEWNAGWNAGWNAAIDYAANWLDSTEAKNALRGLKTKKLEATSTDNLYDVSNYTGPERRNCSLRGRLHRLCCGLMLWRGGM